MPSAIIDLCSRTYSKYSKKVDPETAAAWLEELDGIDEALLEMAAGPACRESTTWPPTPMAVAEHVKRILAETAPARAEPDHWRRSTVQCRQCQDTGRVSIWTPKAKRAALDHVRGDIDEVTMRHRLGHPAAPRCTCEAGNKIAPNKRFHGTDAVVLAYDPNRGMVPIGKSPTKAGQIAELLDWARSWQPPNYESGFDEWNET